MNAGRGFSVLSIVYSVEVNLESKSVRRISFGFELGSLVVLPLVYRIAWSAETVWCTTLKGMSERCES